MARFGEPGAKLHINGFFQGEYEISGDVEVIVDTRSAVFFDYGVDLDDHARLTINSYNDKQNFSVYIADGVQVSVKNGSELTVNTFNTDVDNAAYYSVYGNAPFLVEDARLAVHNAHPNGVAVRLYDPFGGTGVNPAFYNLAAHDVQLTDRRRIPRLKKRRRHIGRMCAICRKRQKQRRRQQDSQGAAHRCPL